MGYVIHLKLTIVQNVNKGLSKRPHSSANNNSLVTVLQACAQSTKNHTMQCAHDTGDPECSVHCILQHEKLKLHIPRLFIPCTKSDNPDCQMEVCKLCLYMCDRRAPSPNFVVRCNEATFMLNGTVS
jgi:hypothetical protein